MIETLILPLALQLTQAPDPPYDPEYSEEARAIVRDRDEIAPQEMVTALETLGERGDASAYQILGEIFRFPLFGFALDAQRACGYFERAGNRPDSLHNLGTCYYDGQGRAQDHAFSRELYSQAAQGGFVMSFCAYGNMLVRGEGGPVDAEEGIRLCRMTAIAGDANAQTDYGTYLLTGQGVERDPVAARFMLEQAGAQDQRNAAFLLAQIYTKGDGVPADWEIATEWFEKAFELGRSDAALETARSYLRRGYLRNEEGEVRIVPAMLEKAREWSLRASEVEQPGSERQQEASELAGAIENLLAAAR